MNTRHLFLLPLALVLACDNGTKDVVDDTDSDADIVDTDESTTDTDEEADPDVICNEYPDNISCEGTVATITGTFTKDIRLTKGFTWVLSGKVEIGEGGSETEVPTETAKLTIDPGVTVYGTGAAYLIVNRGSQIFSNGTASEPVVFTSEARALGDDANMGDWGGLVVNGYAPVNSCATPGCAVAGEAGMGWFGGDDPDDDSGKLVYTRVEFGGFEVLPDEELNGITLNGVGRGTEIHHIQVHANDDDGIEMFGGSVDVKYLVISCHKDDGIDTDLGYNGRIQHALVVQCSEFPESSDPSGSENDGNRSNNTATPLTAAVVSHATFVGKGDAGSANNYGLVIRRGAANEFHNSIVTNFKTACLSVRDDDTAPMVKNSIFDCDTTIDPSNQDAGDDVFDAVDANNVDADPKLPQLTLTLGEDPDYRPASDSPAATGAVQPSDWFDDVAYIGAFDPDGDDWTDGWTDFSAK